MPHQPVMLQEIVQLLAVKQDAVYVDATLGAGGHAWAMLNALQGRGLLLGLDQDPLALELAGHRLAQFNTNLRLANFDSLARLMRLLALPAAQGILLDLGVSSMQLDRAERGFSFMKDAPLDMRMSSQGTSAAELISNSTEKELTRVLRAYGQEPFARAIARKLLSQPVTTTGQLAALVEQALPAAERRRRKLHPATLTFQALRIAVNDELGALKRFLEQIPGLLAKGGRLAIISYHSLEDRLVKQAFNRLANPCVCPPDLPVCVCGQTAQFRMLHKKALRPGVEEVETNPRARSARLRVLEAV